MRYVAMISMFIIIIFVSGCSFLNMGYDDEQVVATVRGTDITMGEVRFSYLDDNIENGIRLLIYKELARQEINDLNLDYSEEWESNQYFVKDLVPKEEANVYDLENWEFAEAQAKKLDMEPNEYHLKYMEREMKDLAYLTTYFNEFYEEPDGDDEEALLIYNQNINVLLDDLAKHYKDDIKVYYKKSAIEKALYKR